MKPAYSIILAILLCFILVSAQNATNETTPVKPPTCVQDHCDTACVKCSDNKCHDPDFKCVEQIEVERYSPVSIPTGLSQLNIALENTGTVILDDIYAIVTGDGIETLDKIPLLRLKPDERDYVFTKINATKPGIIDIVIKVYVSGNINHKFVDQITVIAPKEEEPEEKVNITLLTDGIEQLRQRYRELEQSYQTKISQGYPVQIVYDKLREAYSSIASSQSAILEGEYKRAQAGIALIKSTLDDIEAQLNSAQKQEQTLTDKIKTNLLLYGSVAAALISIFTAYKLVHNSIDRKKLIALHRRITSRKKKKAKRK